MTRRTRPVAWIAAVWLAVVWLAAGGFVSTASSQAPIHMFPDARNAGLGTAGVADNTDPSTIWNNPANAGALVGANLLGYRGEIVPSFSDIILWGGAVSGGYPVYTGDGISVGLGGELRYTKLDYNNSGAFGPGPGSWARTTSLTFAASIQFLTHYDFAAGFTYADWTEELTSDSSGFYPASSGSATRYDFGFRLGATFAAGSWQLVPAIAFARRNTGDPATYDRYDDDEPITTDYIGISFAAQGPTQVIFGNEVPIVALLLNFDVRKTDENEPYGWDIWGVAATKTALYGGAEAAIAQVAFFRFGVRAPDDFDPRILTMGLGLGASLESVRFRVDYSPYPLSVTKLEDFDRENKFSFLVSWIP